MRYLTTEGLVWGGEAPSWVLFFKKMPFWRGGPGFVNGGGPGFENPLHKRFWKLVLGNCSWV